MYFNLFEDHFSYIKDLRSYRKRFSCRKCGTLWKSSWALQRHERTCEANMRYSYLGGYTILTNAFLKRQRNSVSIFQKTSSITHTGQRTTQKPCWSLQIDHSRWSVYSPRQIFKSVVWTVIQTPNMDCLNILHLS